MEPATTTPVNTACHATGVRRRTRMTRPPAVAVVLAAAILQLGCAPSTDERVQLTVATFLGGRAADGLHQEVSRIAAELGSISVSVRVFSEEGLHDYLLRTQPHEKTAPLDLVVVPNDWLGQLAERSLIGDVPASRIEPLQRRLIRQALVAVTDRGRVLGYPLSAEVLALVYDPAMFPSPPATMDAVIRAPLSTGVVPFVVDVSTPYHLSPLSSCFQDDILGPGGGFRLDPPAAAEVFARLRPLWAVPDAWFLASHPDVESLALQLFAEGRVASFLTGPWMLDPLESLDRDFAVVPPPPFAGAPYPSRPPVGYLSVAVSRQSRWVDVAHEVASRLLEQERNDRFNKRARRLPVLLECYKTEQALGSPATLGFLRALENGEAMPASATWGEGMREVSRRLRRLATSPEPPTPAEVEATLEERE